MFHLYYATESFRLGKASCGVVADPVVWTAL